MQYFENENWNLPAFERKITENKNLHNPQKYTKESVSCFMFQVLRYK